MSSHGLVTTVAYKLGKDRPAVFALEGWFDNKLLNWEFNEYILNSCLIKGSVAVAGSALKWLQNNLKILKNIDDSEQVLCDC